eukprot:TRINITY_DN7946_c0_g1_i2.p1 TRINITY_DN7946_c0_g1~~TRINITY_DN7946_c0_g1_i2.p1  ORF type:complete len:559 (-),score=47.71 TRINITY_DN7946_c0_g1_i2:1206-2882(-)
MDAGCLSSIGANVLVMTDQACLSGKDSAALFQPWKHKSTVAIKGQSRCWSFRTNYIQKKRTQRHKPCSNQGQNKDDTASKGVVVFIRDLQMKILQILLLALLSLVTIGATAQAIEPFRLAYSRKLGAEVFILRDRENWCKRLVKVHIVLSEGSPLIKQGIKDFFKDKVSIVLNTECPGVELAVITVSKGKTGQNISTSKASKDEGWLPRQESILPSEQVFYGGLLLLALLLMTFLVRRRRKKTSRGMDIPPSQTIAESTQGKVHTILTARKARPEASSKVESKPIGSTSDSMVVSPEYYGERRKLLNQSPATRNAVEAGRFGGILVLDCMKNIGGGIVFWELGLCHKGEVCEMDAVAIAHHGLLHVEVKNIRGTWKPISERADNGAPQWERIEDGNRIHSPTDQANRARFLLCEASRELCCYAIPVHSLVVVVHDGFKFEGEEDDCVKLMSKAEFQTFYTDYMHGQSKVPAVAKDRIARLLKYVMDHKQLPVFIDAELISEDVVRTANPTREEYMALLDVLLRDWGYEGKQIYAPETWFGDTEGANQQRLKLNKKQVI